MGLLLQKRTTWLCALFRQGVGADAGAVLAVCAFEMGGPGRVLRWLCACTRSRDRVSVLALGAGAGASPLTSLLHYRKLSRLFLRYLFLFTFFVSTAYVFE